MKKKEMIYRIGYSKKNDAFSTWVYVGDKKDPDWEDFGFECEAKCRKLHEEDEEPAFIHYSILTRIRRAIELGYKIEWVDRPE